ncbi:RDD family protein [Fodinicola acaciae]|uniref:RDD family protein n=1 Tax=Fodinicola acaciae TaxID=2681555 RepID=UPI0013D68D36|nr:RDD family protein [Fodinicola acaciae]
MAADEQTEGTPAGGLLLTGEAVAIELPVARLGTRTLAIAIDAACQYGLVYVAQFAMTGLLISGDTAAYLVGLLLTIILVFLVWPIAFETLSRGRSPGKFALGLRVVRDDGGPIRFRQALVRGLVGFALEWPGVLLGPIAWIIGLITLLFNGRAKRLGDIAAGTIVLQERLPDRGVRIPDVPPQLQPWAQTLDLTRLDDELALAMRRLITRASDLRLPALLKLEAELVAEVAEVTAPPPPTGTPPAVFLVSVLAERRRRTLQRSAERRAAAAKFSQQTAAVAAAAFPAATPETPAMPDDPAVWAKPASTEPAAATGYRPPA